MPRWLSIVFTLAVSSPLAARQEIAPSWQDALAAGGLPAAEQTLGAGTDQPAHAFLLGATHFLRALEASLQVRYANDARGLRLLPGMQTRLPANPKGAFSPAFVEDAMIASLEQLRVAEDALDEATTREFAVDIDLAAIWFDIDQDGRRDDWESLARLMEQLGVWNPDGFDGVVRFDSADADWLKAYVHVLSALAEVTLALDPTGAIERVAAVRDVVPVSRLGMMAREEADLVDSIVATLLTLRGKPDPARMAAAHQHFLAMVRWNRSFWRKVVLEDDDDREWVPNAKQTSAFGVTLRGETIEAWQLVLGDLEAVFEGQKLLPFWRLAEDQTLGINLRRVFLEPGDLDLALWLQGAAALPYLEAGELADSRAWQQFESLVSGRGLLFAAWLN